MFPGGGREDAGVGRTDGGTAVGINEATAGPSLCATSWRIHSCCSGVNGGKSAGSDVFDAAVESSVDIASRETILP